MEVTNNNLSVWYIPRCISLESFAITDTKFASLLRHQILKWYFWLRYDNFIFPWVHWVTVWKCILHFRWGYCVLLFQGFVLIIQIDGRKDPFLLNPPTPGLGPPKYHVPLKLLLHLYKSERVMDWDSIFHFQVTFLWTVVVTRVIYVSYLLLQTR